MSRLVQVVGTNGSGKTTTARALMAMATNQRLYTDDVGREVGRKLQLYFGDVYVVGRYRDGLGSGGCDSIKDPNALYETGLPALLAEHGRVFFEGIRMMNHMRGVKLQQVTRTLGVVRLTTPYDEVERRIRERRRLAGGDPDKPLSDDVRGNMKRAEAYCRKVWAVGARVMDSSSDDALTNVIRLFEEG